LKDKENTLKSPIKMISILIGKIRAHVRWRTYRLFEGSEIYWEKRYAYGGNSGIGSYGKFAKFKADIVNRFISEHVIESVIEFGCGDGNQLKLAKYPKYLGFDVSESVIALCKEKFRFDATKDFYLMKDYKGEKADLTLSLDVIYHLVEDKIFESYMATLFNASNRYTIIYSSNSETRRWYDSAHIRHRKFDNWISSNMTGWMRIGYREGVAGSFANFYFYEKL
jgi:hypothetical protein